MHFVNQFCHQQNNYSAKVWVTAVESTCSLCGWGVIFNSFTCQLRLHSAKIVRVWIRIAARKKAKTMYKIIPAERTFSEVLGNTLKMQQVLLLVVSRKKKKSYKAVWMNLIFEMGTLRPNGAWVHVKMSVWRGSIIPRTGPRLKRLVCNNCLIPLRAFESHI